MMKEYLAALVILVTLFALGLRVHATTEAQAITVTTGHYQLDTGDMVTWWLDEPRALLCTALGLDSAAAGHGVGLSCLPLTESVYAWPALPEDK